MKKRRFDNFILFSLTPFGRFVVLAIWAVIIAIGFALQMCGR